MPDALILHPSGAAPLEVFGHWDSEYLQLQHALRRRGRTIPTDPGMPAWDVTLIHAVVNLKRLVPQLSALLATHESELLRGYVPEDFERWGVEDAQPIDGAHGYIHLAAAGWNSWDYPQSFGEWLDEMFQTAADVPEKLRRFGGKEQHAFLWVGSLKAWSALDQLERDEDDAPQPPLPLHAPNVPESLTDIWIASTLVRPSRGILHWRRAAGWEWFAFDVDNVLWR